MKRSEYPIDLGNDLVLRPVQRDDIEESHEINLGLPAPRDLYLWLYFDNPFREDRITGWVVTHPRHGIAGKIWLIWWPARFRGEPIECVLSGDLFVDRRLRGMRAGIGLVQHQFDSFPEGLVLGSSANVNSMGFWRKFGGFTVGLGNVRYQRFLSPLGALRGVASGIPPLRKALAPLAHRSRPLPPPPVSGDGWRTPDLGDPLLLAFLDDTERGLDFSTRRDEKFLRWRYGKCPINEPRILVTEGRSGLNGYLVMQVRTRTKRLDLRVAEVIDFLLDFDDPEARRAVVEASLDWARARGADVVEWRGTHPSVPRLFENRRWVRRESDINPFVCYSAQSEELDLPSRSFHMVLSEGDSALR